MTPAREDRLLNPDGRKHHRKRYSITELRIGLGLLATLALIAAWVGWRGAHPEPELFDSGAGLMLRSSAPTDRGVLPEDLAAPGWLEGAPSQFDAESLYEKINGREDYYKRYGFQRLFFVTLTREADTSMAVDIELFDLGRAANALGAYAGERQPEARSQVSDDGMWHRSRNSLFLTRGRFYLRAIGSAENAEVLAQLQRIRSRSEALPSEPMPWGFRLLAGLLDIDPVRITYQRENAFSFGFASNVYSAKTGPGETELFVTVQPDARMASELAAKLRDGFASIGDPVGDSAWIKHRYLGEIAGAVHAGTWIAGVRGAPDVGTAARVLSSLTEALRTAPEVLRTQALQEAAPDRGGDEEKETYSIEGEY